MLSLVLFVFDVALRRIDLTVWLPARWSGLPPTMTPAKRAIRTNKSPPLRRDVVRR